MELEQNEAPTTSATISIWQQNVNKSPTCQHELISSAKLARRGIDIVALQEPAINFLGNTVTARDWIAVYPSTHSVDPTKTCSLFLIRSNILTEKWKQIEFPSEDVTAIQISGNWGEITIYNIYNDCNNNNTIYKLEDLNRRHEDDPRRTPDKAKHVVWLGDFNRHHPHWDNLTDTRLFTKVALENAEILINAVAEAGLDLALPPGIPTHIHNVSKKWTRLDQVFISEDALDSVLVCEALSGTQGINTDHLPILTTLDLDLARAPSKPPHNFRNVNWQAFEKDLAQRLTRLPPPQCICTQSELDTVGDELTKALQDTIAANHARPRHQGKALVDKGDKATKTRYRQERERGMQIQRLAGAPYAQ